MNSNCSMWNQDGFEDLVARMLIAAYETNVRRQRDIDYSQNFRESDLPFIRRIGPFISKPGETVQTSVVGTLTAELPTLIPPKEGVVGISGDWIRVNPEYDKNQYNGYVLMYAFRMVRSAGKGWQRVGAGNVYELMKISYENLGIRGERRYFTMSKDGKISPCDFSVRGRSASRYATEFFESSWIESFVAVSVYARKSASWYISAIEQDAKVHIECTNEEIKSLLYARSIPLTATGRKRPILHLVESHKRRMKNGVDIDVTTFLRGSREVEMNGTRFVVSPPKVISQDVSDASQKYFESA